MTVYPPLVLTDDLDGYPGAPYPTNIIRGAETSVRGDCHWHIAPQVRETVTIVARHRRLLPLPTLRVVEVHAVTSAAGTNTAWIVRGNSLDGFWVVGARYTVDLTHGHEQVPADLVGAIAARCQQALIEANLTQRSESIGSKTTSESFNPDPDRLAKLTQLATSGLTRHRLPGRF